MKSLHEKDTWIIKLIVQQRSYSSSHRTHSNPNISHLPNPQSNRHIISKSKYMFPIKSHLAIKVDLQSLQPDKFNSHSIPMLKYPHRNDQKILLIMENGCKLYFIFWWTHPWFNARMPQIFHHLLLFTLQKAQTLSLSITRLCYSAHHRDETIERERIIERTTRIKAVTRNGGGSVGRLVG